MTYRIILVLLFFTISINSNLFSQDNDGKMATIDTIVPANTLIPVMLENEVNPNSSLRAKIIVVVEENVLNKSSTQVIIPKYTRITCQETETKRLEKVDAIFASCNQIFLPNGKVINFTGNLLDKTQKVSITTEKNRAIAKGTHLLVKPDGSINIE